MVFTHTYILFVQSFCIIAPTPRPKSLVSPSATVSCPPIGHKIGPRTSGSMESLNATRSVPISLAEERTSALLLSAIVAVLVGVAVYSWSRKQRPLPPGPRRWPLIGNALDMPREKEWLAFTEWGKTYGLSVAHPIVTSLDASFPP
jgi:hypothetical protein